MAVVYFLLLCEPETCPKKVSIMTVIFIQIREKKE